MGLKGEGFARTIVKHIWTITGAGGNRSRRWGGLGWWGGVGGKGRKLYLNNNKKMLKKWVCNTFYYFERKEPK